MVKTVKQWNYLWFKNNTKECGALNDCLQVKQMDDIVENYGLI